LPEGPDHPAWRALWAVPTLGLGYLAAWLALPGGVRSARELAATLHGLAPTPRRHDPPASAPPG
jgi:hypothetical protein